MKKSILIIYSAVLLLAVSCNDKEIDAINQRIDTLENVSIASLQAQLTQMNTTLGMLQSTQTQLSGYVTTLQTSVGTLQGNYSSLQSAVSALQQKDQTFENNLQDLQDAIGDSANVVKRWVESSYATLQQFTQVQTDITGIKTDIQNIFSRLDGLDQTTQTIANNLRDATADLTGKLGKCQEDIAGILEDIEALQGDMDTVKQQIAAIISAVQSVAVVPDYTDGSVKMTDEVENIIRFEVYPLEAAENLATLGVSSLSLDYVETETKSSALTNIPLTSVSFDGEFLNVTADGTGLKDEVKAGTASAHARLRISDGTVVRGSGYFPLTLTSSFVITPFTSITIISPDQSDPHYKDGKFKYVVGETFQLQAVGEPSEANDEIEYFVYGWSNNNYLNYYNVSETGLVEAIGAYSNCRVAARSKADESIQTVFTFDVLPAPENIRLVTRQEDSEVQVYTTSPNYRRNTQYIGRGTTQKFKVVVEPSNAPQDVNISQGPSWSAASASISNGILSVSVASNASVSTTSNEVKFTLSLKASNGHTDDFTFKVCLYDPYKVKVGDLIAKDGKIYDGGARGKGLFEDSIRKDGNDNSIIAWLGNNHTAEDPFWSTCAPSEGLKTAQGTVIHGIAIPTHTDRLYRTEEAAGEYYYGDDGNDNYILDSGNLPSSWLTTNERKNLLRSISDKHSAIFNTCVYVYTNNGRGSSWEIRPANFFVDPYTVFPGESGKSISDIQTSRYYFWGAFGYSYSGAATFAYYAKNESAIAGKYMTTWLWPTIADFYSVFTGGDNPSSLQAFSDNVAYDIIEDRVEIFKHSANQAGVSGPNTPEYDCYWWIANESGRDTSSNRNLRITQATVTSLALRFNTNSLHNNSTWKAYVLPIRYF